MTLAFRLYGQFILRDLLKNWARTLLTVSGIALGVAVVLAISLANDTVTEEFEKTVNLVAGKANLELLPTTTAFLQQDCLDSIRWLWMLDAKFTPVIQENVVLNDSGKTLVQMVGIDMLHDPEFDTFESSSGGDSNQTSDRALEKDAAFIGARLAHDHHLRPGDKFEILANESVHRLKVARILPEKGLGAAFGGNNFVVDILTAQNVLGAPSKISQIEIISPPSNLAQIKEKLQAELPAEIKAQEPSRRGSQVEKMTRSFKYNLLALTFIAVLVGMFLIYNTTTISVIRRRSEIGTLRTLGVTRGGILALFMAEAVSSGILGSAAGVVLGLLFSQGALSAVAATVQHFYISLPLERVEYNSTILFLAFFLGLGATVVASIAPALEAASVQPAEATRSASYEVKAKGKVLSLSLKAGLAILLAGATSFLPPISGFPIFGYLAAFLCIVGCSLSMPLILQLCLPIVSRLCDWGRQPEARLAARSLEGALGRTAVAAASLMIGIAMMVSLAIMIASFRQTVMLWVEQTLKADIFVQTQARANGSQSSRMLAETVHEIESMKGVAAVDGFVQYQMEYKGEPCNLAAADLAIVGQYGHLTFTDGENSANLCGQISDSECIISEAFAIRKGVHNGDTIKLETPSGPLNLKVRGTYFDYSSDLGFIIIQRTLFSRQFKDNTISDCAVYLNPGVDTSTMRSAILAKLGNRKRLSVQTTRELRVEALRLFDRTFSITYALHTIAIVVAMLAVTNALLALTLESRRDFGILRYLGAGATQLRKIVLFQAVLLGVIGNVGGVILGLLLSLLLIYVINRQSFGWTVQFSIPFVFLMQSSLLVVCTALVAGLWPARQAAITQAPSVVREE